MDMRVGGQNEKNVAGGVLRFGACRLDVDRGVLTAGDGTETMLRPKTLDLALFLLLNPRRVVSRAEILDAIWPGIFVTDDSVTQCVTELRRAMGAEGAALLKTLPRRGYLLDSEVVAEPATLPGPVPVPESQGAARIPPAAPNSPAPARAVLRYWASLAAAGLAGASILVWLAWPTTGPAPPAPAAPLPVASPPAPAPVPAADPTGRERAIELVELARRRNIAPGDRRANWMAARDLLALSCTRFLWTPICPRRDQNDDVRHEADGRSFGR